MVTCVIMFMLNFPLVLERVNGKKAFDYTSKIQFLNEHIIMNPIWIIKCMKNWNNLPTASTLHYILDKH